MDVGNLNASDRNAKNKLKKPVCNANISQFSIETYFIWFSALIFITELIVDIWLAILYFHRDKIQWGLITIGLIIVPLVLCQIYSLWLLRTDSSVRATALCMHVLLLGIPYRYHNILRKVEKDKSINQEWELIKQRIRDVNAIQTVNAIFQYCPQFLFQSFLIVYRKYKCVITGVSAGLAGFSFLWHVFIHFYYLVKRYNEDDDFERCAPSNMNTRIIDNLSTSFNENNRNLASGPSSIISNNLSQASTSLSDSLRNFEKPMYKTDDKNLVSKKHGHTKNVEKNKIFGFNKRKPIYEREDFDLYESNNISTVFFEIDDSNLSGAGSGCNKFDLSSTSNKELDNFINENSSNMHTSKNLNDFKYKFNCESVDDELKREKMKKTVTTVAAENRNSLLKRKGICSSQEMLHLVDIMNDHISPEQVDALAKSLVDMGGDASLQTESEHEDPDNSKLLEQFPDMIDDRLLENIDAAIYENQIIFQERIRKNQLTIQNLKLQDQMLSKCIEDMKSLPNNEILSIRDYENMCFTNISRQNRGMKHWRNYLHDIDTSNHDNSTVQHSSYYVNTNTMSNSLTDLYINETEENASTVMVDDVDKMSLELGTSDACGNGDGQSVGGGGGGSDGGLHKKTVRWRSKLGMDTDRIEFCCDDETVSDDLYINMDDGRGDVNGEDGTDDDRGSGGGGGGARALPEKNILVETINKINVDSPIKSLLTGGTNHKLSQSNFKDSSSLDKI